MAGKRANGEGTVPKGKRKDGRFLGQVSVLTVSGHRKRVSVYGKTRQEVQEKLTAVKMQGQQGIPVPDRTWKLGDYLDYWLDTFVKRDRRPKTYVNCELAVRLYLKPGIGSRALTALSVPVVQSFLNGLLEDGKSVRMVQVVRTTLSGALTRAQREELVSRNVARLVELPEYKRKKIVPWSLDEAKLFLAAAADHRLFAAFALLLFYGLREGEVLGLRWCDIDREKGVIHIAHQLQRVEGKLTLLPVKTDAGERDLPIVARIGEGLDVYRRQQASLRGRASRWSGSGDDEELVFTTNVGTAIEARNFLRTFYKICNENNLRVIKVHHLRHTAATLLKDLGVPGSDRQKILGHANIATTQQIYEYVSMESRTEAIEKVQSVFAQVLGGESEDCSQNCSQMSSQTTRLPFMQPHPIYKFGGPGGTRTLDILLKRQPRTYSRHRLQSVKAAMQMCTRELLVGCVAVNVAVRSHMASPEESPIDHQVDMTSLSAPEAALGRAGLFANGLEGSSELQGELYGTIPR